MDPSAWGPKDISSSVDDPSGKAASKIHHAKPDPERCDTKLFTRNDTNIPKVR